MTPVRVLFRCDGSQRLGLGHVVRCAAIAGALRERYGAKVAFALREGPPARSWLQHWDAEVPCWYEPAQDARGETWLQAVVEQFRPEVIVYDLRDDTSADVMRRIAEQRVLSAVIDDGSQRRFAAQLAFYPPVPQVRDLDWSGFRGELHVGWQWVALREEFAVAAASGPSEAAPATLLVAAGGTDPAAIALRVAVALNEVPLQLDVTFLVGSGYLHRPALESQLRSSCHRWHIAQGVAQVVPVMRRCRMAITAFGMTAYELACVGVPALYVCLNPDHARAAEAFVLARLGESLGLWEDCTDARLAQALALAGQRAKRPQDKVPRAPGLDGRGAQRIAAVLVARARP